MADWVEVDQSDALPALDPDFTNGVCTFSSAAFLEIFYEKIGTADAAQKVI